MINEFIERLGDPEYDRPIRTYVFYWSDNLPQYVVLYRYLLVIGYYTLYTLLYSGIMEYTNC